jgi:hypothetical protein
MAKQPNKQQLLDAYIDFMGSDMLLDVSVPHELRFDLAPIKEHLIVYMWENFIKGQIFLLEAAGGSVDDFMEEHEPMELLEMFAEYQIGYWQGVNQNNEETI